MRKIAVVGDVHGRRNWETLEEKFLEKGITDIVFIGDYLDSRDPEITGEMQLENLNRIIKFRDENPDLVTLLIGNHDFHYISPFESYSGYQNDMAYKFGKLLNGAIKDDKIKAVKIIDKYLFSHAGLSEIWCDNYKIDMSQLEEDLNLRLKRTPMIFGFQEIPDNDVTREFKSEFGDNSWQSPIWIRPDSLFKTKIPGYTQIVGHTTFDKPTFKNDVWFVDDRNSSFLVLENY